MRNLIMGGPGVGGVQARMRKEWARQICGGIGPDKDTQCAEGPGRKRLRRNEQDRYVDASVAK